MPHRIHPTHLLSHRLPLICAGILGFISTQVDMRAQVTVVFTPGHSVTVDGVDTGQSYDGGIDVELNQEYPATNLDSGTSDDELSIDGNSSDIEGSGDERQAVLRFDGIFDLIPNGSTIQSASLFFDIDNTGNDLRLYQLAGGFSWTEESATWNNFGTSPNDGVLVGTETVGDYMTIDGGGDKTNADITSIVESWYSGAPNNGLALLPTGGNGVDIDSMEVSSFDDRPALTIVYAPVPEPSTYAAGMALVAGGAAIFLRRRQRRNATENVTQ